MIFLDCVNTVNTTRIPDNSAIEMSVAVSQMLWPVSHTPKSPKVVILAPDSEFPYAYMAASLVHDPIMGDLLITSSEELAEVTRQEIKRIDPPGIKDVPPVITVGPFHPRVVREIESMGYLVLAIEGKNIFATAANVARFRQKVSPEFMSLFVISAASPFSGMPVPYYSTHSGIPILFTHPKRLPASTARVLQEMNDKTVYIVGGARSVGESVEKEINELVAKPVKRVAGADPFATAVKFAKYFDSETGLGWHRDKKGRGDAFTFGNIERWDLAMAAANMAHRGKHTPLLLVESDSAPPVVLDYLESLKPEMHDHHPMPPFMHGFILGTEEEISYEIQRQLEMAMEIE